MKLRKLPCVVAVGVLALASVSANAELIQSAVEGNIFAYFDRSASPFNWDLGVKVNGIEYPTKGLPSTTSQAGDELWLGHVMPGDSLVWFVERSDTGFRMYSDNDSNWKIGPSTSRAFGTPENGFTDYVFNGGIAYNPTSEGPGPVPEPASWAMMIAGFGMIGALTRKRKRTARQEVLA